VASARREVWRDGGDWRRKGCGSYKRKMFFQSIVCLHFGPPDLRGLVNYNIIQKILERFKLGGMVREDGIVGGREQGTIEWG
jgi:hypothetical protein